MPVRGANGWKQRGTRCSRATRAPSTPSAEGQRLRLRDGQQHDRILHGEDGMSRRWDEEQVALSSLPRVLTSGETDAAVEHLQRRLAGTCVLTRFRSGEHGHDGLTKYVLVPAEDRRRAPASTAPSPFKLLTGQRVERHLPHGASVPQRNLAAGRASQPKAVLEEPVVVEAAAPSDVQRGAGELDGPWSVRLEPGRGNHRVVPVRRPDAVGL